MKKYLGLMLGIVTSAALFAGSTYASTGVQNLKVSYANIGIVVNGKAVTTTAEPFIYHYNVYVPVSTVGHALSSSVAWVNKPAAVVVTDQSAVKPLNVYVNGQQLPSGITNDHSFVGIPLLNSSYFSATGIQASVDTSGNVETTSTSSSSLPAGETPLLSLTPTALYGDFSNTQLYPNGQLSNYWVASILGQLYPGQDVIQWGIIPGQTVKIPGVDYALGGHYASFTANVAIDDLSKNFNGEVQLVFVGDGKTIGQTGWVQSGAEPTPVSLNVTGVQTLEIQYQLKDPSGQVYLMGTTYTAPAQNPDGSTTDPIVGVDVVNAALSTSPPATSTPTTSTPTSGAGSPSASGSTTTAPLSGQTTPSGTPSGGGTPGTLTG